MIYRTTTYHKIKAITTKIKVVQGSQGAGKNISMAQLLFEDAIEKRRTITVVTDTYDNLRDGAIADFKGQFMDMGLEWEDYYHRVDKELHIQGSVIQFRYISDIKANAGKSKRRDILYINEANKIGWSVASTYIGRTHEKVYIDYNPDEEFWAHTELPKLKDRYGKQLATQIIVTYKDNEMLPQSEIDYIESRRDNVEWFRVYGLGLTGYYSERRIYKCKVIDTIPDTAIRIESGIDFGSSPDPTVLVDLWLDGNNLYANEVFSMNNLLPEKISGADRMSISDKLEDVGYTKGHPLVADSAGATEIRDLRKHGHTVIGVKKPVGSVLTGIKILRGYNLFVTKGSKTILDGVSKWFFKIDRNGKIIPEPMGHEPDALAAIRYVMMNRGKTILEFF